MPGHDKDNRPAAHRRAGSFLLLVLFCDLTYKVRVHYMGAVRDLFLLCWLFIERSAIQCIYGIFK